MALTTVQAQTYLQLCQALWREVGASGNSAPLTTVGATGEWLRLVNYVHDAELDIQNMWVDWKWLRKTLSAWTPVGANTGIFTASGGAVSAQPADLAEWDYPTFQILPYGSTFYQPLVVHEWQEVRREVFDLVDQAQPWRVIVMPDNTLRWDLTPDQAYAIQAEYRSVPYDLKNDTDVSNIPARFGNRLILEYARLKYGWFENAQEQIGLAQLLLLGNTNNQGVLNIQGLITQLENDQLPNKKNSRLQQGNFIVVGGGRGSDGDYSGYYQDY
jgi:hypothetical protein